METQATVAMWADATLGAVMNPVSHVTRAMKEMAELAMCLANDPADPHAVEEAADVVIVLTRLAEKFGVDIIAGARDQRLQWVSPLSGEQWAESAAVDLAMLWDSDLYGSEDREPAVDMLLNVVACLDGFLVSRGADLREEITKKMAINRRRQWRLDGHGHGYHLKPHESAAFGSFEDRAQRAELDEQLELEL
jgi:hypothetical protein